MTVVQSGTEMLGGGGEEGSAVGKIYGTGPWKLATISLYNPLKSPMGAHVYKTTYGPLIDTAFLGPKWHSPDGSMPFHRA